MMDTLGIRRGGSKVVRNTAAVPTLVIDNGWQVTVTVSSSQKATKTLTKNVLMISEF